MKKNYSEILKDPQWQRKRLEVLERDKFTCQSCNDTKATLHVHHRYYISGRLPWEYPGFCYLTLCKTCHDEVQLTAEYRRAQGETMFEDWEAGLDFFGDEIFTMMAEEAESMRTFKPF